MVNVSDENELIYRKVLHVHENDRFIFDLSWIDHKSSMHSLPKFVGHEIIDTPYTKPETIRRRFFKEKPSVTGPRGRPVNPKTEFLPLAPKLGRPKNEARNEKDILFGNIQVAKPIVSKEDIKHYRLVSLTAIKGLGQGIKYSVKELSTFYLPKQELDTMVNLSWHKISMSELGYYNSDLKLSRNYTLPLDFFSATYYSKEESQQRYQRKAEKQRRAQHLIETIEPFIEYYNSYQEFIYRGPYKDELDPEDVKEFISKYVMNKEGILNTPDFHFAFNEGLSKIRTKEEKSAALLLAAKEENEQKLKKRKNKKKEQNQEVNTNGEYMEANNHQSKMRGSDIPLVLENDSAKKDSLKVITHANISPHISKRDFKKKGFKKA